jgi:hypothetical protein
MASLLATSFSLIYNGYNPSSRVLGFFVLAIYAKKSLGHHLIIIFLLYLFFLKSFAILFTLRMV